MILQNDYEHHIHVITKNVNYVNKNIILHRTNGVIPHGTIVTDALHIHGYMSTYAINYEHVLNFIVYLAICVYALSYIILM